MTKIIAFANQKGGVGKTTSVLNTGAALAEKGKAVFIIDIDPQAHLTAGSGISPYEVDPTIYDVMKGEADPAEALIKLETEAGALHLLPASIGLATAESEFLTEPGREYMLKEGIARVKDYYDYILIDCPPSLGILTINGLAAADNIIIPLQTEFFALHGTRQLYQIIKKVQARINPELELAGVLITMVDTRNNIHSEIIESIRSKFNNQVFNTVIKRNIALVEAPSYGQSIFTYRANSTGAKDYRAFVNELIKVG